MEIQASLSKKVKDVDKALGDRIHSIEKEQTYYRVLGTVALAMIIALTVNWLKDVVSPRPLQPANAILGPPSPQSPNRP